MYYESSHKQLLFGVSQQDFKDRLPGQVEEQINMTSDLTFNLRRRAPLRFLSFLGISTPSQHLGRYETTVTNARVVFLWDTDAGSIRVLTESGTVLATFTDTYFQASNANALRLTTLGDEVYVANTEVQPTASIAAEQAGYPDPTKAGYLFVTAGQFSKTFTLAITNQTTGVTTSVSFTTPDGSSADHAAQATPEYIVDKLADAAEADALIGTAAGFTYYRTGGYLYITSDDDAFATSSDSGTNYIRTSNFGKVRELSDLPARLADEADGLIMGVGTTRTPTYYRWDNAERRWVEDAGYGFLTQLGNMPRRMRRVDGTWTLDSPVWERRAAGDDESNATPKFIEKGITGLAAFQGRLVILANDYVNMSASNNPLRFYRSTITGLQSDDPIEVASTAAQAAPYTWATAFNKDLVLWADRYQSVIPGVNAVTPSNANISVMSQYEARLDAVPVTTGRSVFFSAPRSDGYDGLWEAVPSQYTDSQLIAGDVTNHIPRYIKGTTRFMTASSTSNILVAGFSENLKELLVHEFLWAGAEKAHHAWHKWVFHWDVESAWFVGDKMYCLLRVGTELVYAQVDLRIGAGDSAATTGRLDLQVQITTDSAGEFVVDERLADAWTEAVAFKTSGEYPYMRTLAQEVSRAGGQVTYRLLGAAAGDTYTVGRRFRSLLVPTSPTVRDRNDVPITTAKALLHKYIVTVQNTGEFTYSIGDRYRPQREYVTSTLTFGSPELSVGLPQVASGYQYIPARLDMYSSRLELATDDVYDLNITSIEYGYRYHQRSGRRV
jgi:hypothetical protein